MYTSGYNGMGVNTSMYPQNIYIPGTPLPTINTGITSNANYTSPGGFLQPGIQGVGVGGYSAQPIMPQPVYQQQLTMQQPVYQQQMTMQQPVYQQQMTMQQPVYQQQPIYQHQQTMQPTMIQQPIMQQTMIQQPMYQPTQWGMNGFNPDMDCSALRGAMRGLGTDEDTIINIICSRNNIQRQEIKRYYISAYGRDLIKDLKSELSGNFENVVTAMFQTPSEFDATCLYKAMKGLGTDEGVLIEIIGSRSSYELSEIKRVFKIMYGKELIKWIESETSGNLRKLLVSLLTNQRSENTIPNQQQCMNDAQALYQGGEARWGTDETIFNNIFSTRSKAEIVCIDKCYINLRGKSIEKAIDNEFSGDTKKLFKTLFKVLINTPAYFAQRIHEAVDGLGTNDKKLIRNIVSRCEIDMPLIKQAYRNMYGREMLSDVRGDTSGDYKKILSKLIERY